MKVTKYCLELNERQCEMLYILLEINFEKE